MTKLSWGDVGKRFFETGVDRGVLYRTVSGVNYGVAWDGLTSVMQKPIGGDPQPYYQDGVRYSNGATREEFTATITAFTYPEEFAECDGTAFEGDGLAFGLQPRQEFGLSYRTMVGNDTDGVEHGYLIHLVYNALATPTDGNYATIGSIPTPATFSWDITTRPVSVEGRRPTSHITIDSRTTPPILLGYLEGYLYGANGLEPRLPSIAQIRKLFEWAVPEYGSPVNLIGSWESEKAEISNLFTNPSFEAGSGAVAVRRNYATNPLVDVVNSETLPSRVTQEKDPTRDGALLTISEAGNVHMAQRIGQQSSKRMPVSPGESVTLSAKVMRRSTWSTQLAGAIYWFDSSGTYLSMSEGAPVSLASVNTVYALPSLTATAPANAAGATWNIGVHGTGARAVGDKFNVHHVLFEKAAVALPFFTGAYQPRVRENLFPNPAVVSAAGFTSAEAQATRTYTGSAVRWTALTNSWTECRIDTPSAVTGGTSARLLVRARANRPLTARLRLRGNAGPKFTLGTEWAWYDHVAMAGSGNTMIGMEPGDGHVAGDWVEVDRVLIEEGYGEWFDGSSGAPQGFATAWTGAANASSSFMYDADLTAYWTVTANESESVLTGVPVAGVRANECVAIRSAKFGGSMRLIPTTTSYNTYAEANPYPGYFGQQTIVGTLHLEAPITGTLNSRALRITSASPIASSGAAPNVAGSYERRLTTATGTPSTQGRILFEHGGSRGSGDVYWTMGGLFQGVYDGPWFSGSTESLIYQGQMVYPYWKATPEASISSFDYVTELPSNPRIGDAYLIEDDIWVYTGVWVNYGPYPVEWLTIPS